MLKALMVAGEASAAMFRYIPGITVRSLIIPLYRFCKGRATEASKCSSAGADCLVTNQSVCVIIHSVSLINYRKSHKSLQHVCGASIDSSAVVPESTVPLYVLTGGGIGASNPLSAPVEGQTTERWALR